jgi:hypothetical protein
MLARRIARAGSHGVVDVSQYGAHPSRGQRECAQRQQLARWSWRQVSSLEHHPPAGTTDDDFTVRSTNNISASVGTSKNRPSVAACWG